ncbi:uncharacterized protein SOCE836_014200 [Sorangium cellulosum]|uniref:Uncharacterized protein n=1 Tax=Sorangium cellulosum TaxID=56 RepID=A0A4V0NFD9_SORCE|nr:uncharacterized protein SOCE836_014200 [Sorangium cellulosum]WCQ88724.1 hypothetical protein NQZ70_01404 [Sorangium sp. Soce836]
MRQSWPTVAQLPRCSTRRARATRSPSARRHAGPAVEARPVLRAAAGEDAELAVSMVAAVEIGRGDVPAGRGISLSPPPPS